jgi:hypothetical protein
VRFSPPALATLAWLALLAVLPLLAAAIPAARAQIGINEFLPRQAPALKRFSVVASTANNQCLTVQPTGSDITRLRPDVLLSPCEFSIDNQTQGFFITRTVRERNQIFFAANPAYCLAMDPRNRRLVAVACGVNAEMFAANPQHFELRRGGLAVVTDSGEAWCVDTRAREGFSQLFEPYFMPCPSQIGEAFMMRVNR